MTMIDTGAEPGRQQREPGPEDRIRELRREYPLASAAQIRAHYKTWARPQIALEAEHELMRIVDDWLLRYVPDERPARRQRTEEEREAAKEERRALAERIKAADDARIEIEVKIRLLEWQTTYGKPLADCTGAECLRLSRRYGPFFAEIAKRLNPSDKVRNHLSETELQAIALAHRLIGPEALR